MSALRRAFAITCAAALAVPLWAVPASAATAAETASTAAYYLASNPGVVGADPNNPLGGQKAPDNAKSADGVAEDDLAVAVVAAGTGRPDKFSALRWDLIDLLPGSTVTKATFTIPYSTRSTSSDKDPTLFVACLSGPEGFGDGDGQPFQDAPSVLCTDAFTQGTNVEGGSAVEFDVTAIAQKWAAGTNDGLVLYPSEAGFGRPFQTAFADKSQARITVQYTAAEGFEELTTDDFGDTGSVTVDSATPTGTTDVGTTDFSGGSFTGGSFTGGTGTATTPLTGSALSTPQLPSAEAPAVAGAATSARPVTRAAASAPSLSPDAVTWAAIVGGALLLVAVSLSLGSSTTGAAAASPIRAGGVASALAVRRPTLLPSPRG